jgi:hypothetical protein
MTKKEYLELLEHNYRMELDNPNDYQMSRLEYLSEYIFDYTTYDSEISEMLAGQTLEVCEAISNKTTFEFISDPARYVQYISMVNMPFFQDRLSWGTSIRGAWWDRFTPTAIEKCYLRNLKDETIRDLVFAPNEWKEFISAMIEFGKGTSDETSRTNGSASQQQG